MCRGAGWSAKEEGLRGSGGGKESGENKKQEAGDGV